MDYLSVTFLLILFDNKTIPFKKQAPTSKATWEEMEISDVLKK